MRFCYSAGIPHSRFLDWEEEDRAKALAWMTYEAQVCSMCGTAPWEWNPEEGGSRFAYEPVEEICPGCERKDWLRDSTEHRAGRTIVLKPADG
jgi:hypothetical protein